VALDLRHTAGAVWALSDRGMTISDHDGNTVSVDWQNQYLRRYTLSGDGFAAVLLGKYRAGSQAELWVVDSQGQRRILELNDGTRRSLALSEQVMSISTAGRYVAVLTGDRLDIYTQELELYSSLKGTKGARTVLLVPDGSAILISAEGAGFYIP
jgi:hypothetical protein